MIFCRPQLLNNALLALLGCLFFWQSAAYGQSWPKDVVVGRCSQKLTAPAPENLVIPPVPDTAAEVAAFAEANRQRFQYLLPNIPTESLIDLRKVRNNGRVNRGTYEATLNGKEVFIKMTAAHMGAKEGFWLTFLNRHGLGPRFLGITPLNNGWGTVLEKIDGISSKDGIIFALGKIPRVVREDMRDQIVQLYELGIYPFDVQFVLNSERAVVMDVEHYQSLDRNKWTLEKIIHDFEYEFSYFKLDED